MDEGAQKLWTARLENSVTGKWQRKWRYFCRQLERLSCTPCITRRRITRTRSRLTISEQCWLSTTTAIATTSFCHEDQNNFRAVRAAFRVACFRCGGNNFQRPGGASLSASLLARLKLDSATKLARVRQQNRERRAYFSLQSNITYRKDLWKVNNEAQARISRPHASRAEKIFPGNFYARKSPILRC